MWKVFELWCNQYAWQAAHLMLTDSCREEMEWFDQTCLVPGVQPPLYMTLFTLFPATDLNSTIEFGHLLKAEVSRTQGNEANLQDDLQSF